MDKSIRVIHDGSFNNTGGAARVAKQIAKTFDAKVTVGHSINPEFWEEVNADIVFRNEFNEGISGWLYDNIIPKPYADLRVSQKFKGVEFDEDVLITTSDVSKWIIPRHDQIHIDYCHVPPEDYYATPRETFFGWVKQTGMGVLDRYFTSFCDGMIANSEFTQQRIRRHYQRNAPVIHPPVRVDDFYNANSEGYYVTIGRLVSMKRMDLVAKTFKILEEDLIVIGDGPLRKYIEQTGASVYPNPSDKKVEDIVAKAEAGIAFADHEHCGLTPKEFQAAGKPVIVPDEPNLKNHVSDGVTGVIVDPSSKGLRCGIKRIKDSSWDPKRIQKETEGWSIQDFRRKCREYVAEVTENDSEFCMNEPLESQYL